MEIFFLTKFPKNISYKSVMVILSTSDITVSNPPESIVDSYFIAGHIYRGTDESRDRITNLMHNDPRGKIGKFFDVAGPRSAIGRVPDS